MSETKDKPIVGLLIEDELTQMLAANSLRLAGMIERRLDDSEKLIELARAGDINTVVLDAELLGLRLVPTISRLRDTSDPDDDSVSSVGITVLTWRGENPEMIADAAASGADRFLEKPLRSGALIEGIEETLRLAKGRYVIRMREAKSKKEVLLTTIGIGPSWKDAIFFQTVEKAKDVLEGLFDRNEGVYMTGQVVAWNSNEVMETIEAPMNIAA